MKLRKLLGNWKIVLLMIVLIFSLIAIEPNPWAKGVQVNRVEFNSSASDQGIREGELIKSINGITIDNLQDYSKVVNDLEKNSKVELITDKDEYVFLLEKDLGIGVREAEGSNLKKGLDLAGGTRVLLKPVSDEVSDQEINNLIDVLRTRLDVYGLSDLIIRGANDLSGNKYVLIEISGVTEQEVKELIAQQGKFEAKIANDTVFVGEKKDITYVCKDDGTCSGVRNCDNIGGSYSCRFEFAIRLSENAAKNHAEVTNKYGINFSSEGGRYLDQPLDLYLDNKLVDSLLIGADLKGQEVQDIAISGPGVGATQQMAIDDALKNMNKLQTVLLVGSLPFDLDIVSISTISPVLGTSFIKNVLLAAIFAILAVAIVVFLRYRRFKIIIPMIVTMVSEILIILGVAAFIRWRLDIVSIAGILASVGTGVDDQVVITDETLKGAAEVYNWKEKLKRAFFIIMVAYLATVAGMLPLFWAGAGLIRGFALTTILGVTIGVFVTRPAFAAMIENLIKEE